VIRALTDDEFAAVYQTAKLAGLAEAFLECAAEAERMADEIDRGCGREMPVEAAGPLETLAAWARERAT